MVETEDDAMVETEDDKAVFEEPAAGTAEDEFSFDAFPDLPEEASEGTTATAAAAPVSYPEHEVLGLPSLSPTMENGKIMEWTVKEGEQVYVGDVICEIETDKATVGYEVLEDGYLAKILQPAGDTQLELSTVKSSF